MFIYEIQNKVNGKRLIGQTTQKYAHYRWHHHKKVATDNVHDNPHFQNAWNKYGERNFEFSIIESDIESESRLNELEIHYIAKFDTLNPINGYNIREGGKNGRLSEETKKKLKGRIPWNKGEPWSDEMREKISESLIGRTFSKEEKDKRSKRKNGKTYPIVVDPVGNEYVIENCARFCREHQLVRTTFCLLWSDTDHRIKVTHGGWRLKERI